MNFKVEAFWYIVVVAIGQTTVTAMASSASLSAGACVGGASILANLILYAFVRIELARKELDRVVMDRTTALDVGTAFHEAVERDPTATFRTLRRRTVLALAAKRRKATIA